MLGLNISLLITNSTHTIETETFTTSQMLRVLQIVPEQGNLVVTSENRVALGVFVFYSCIINECTDATIKKYTRQLS